MTQDMLAENSEQPTGRLRFREASLDRYGRAGIFGGVVLRGGRDPYGLGRGMWSGGTEVPFYPQMTAADCGPACLRMVLASRGVHVSARQLREDAESGRNGVSASKLLELGRRYGLDGRGVRTDLAGLAHLTSGAILFWRFNHFVVLVRATRSHLLIIDPAVGRRRIGWNEADTDFTGIALEFTEEAVTPALRAASETERNESVAVAAAFLPRTRRWLWAAATSALLLVYALAFPFLLGRLVNAGPDVVRSSLDARLRWVAVLLFAIISFGLLHFSRSRLIVSIQSLLEERAGHLLMSRLSRLPLEFFSSRHPGDLAQRVRSTARLRQVISVTTVGAVFDALMVLGYVLVIGIRQFWLALAIVACIAGFALVTASSWRRQRQLSSDVLEARTKSASELHEILTNMTTVKALGAESVVHARWLNSFSDELTTGTRQRRHAGAISSFTATLQFAAPLMVLLAGLFFAVHSGADLSATISLAALSSGLFVSMSNLSLASNALIELTPDLQRMNDVLTSPAERGGLRGLTRGGPPPTVRLERLSYTYRGATDESVREVTAQVGSGQVLAIIGPSGSGKSTLGMLIGGLLDPTSGRLLIDETDLSEIDPIEYRKCIGYVDQNSTLLSGSIMDNIALSSPEASLDEVRAAARIAEIDDFISTLPMKYETILGSGGAGLSGGQRQRIALARALLEKPSLLILDEATSAVDPDTERKILRNIRELHTTTVLLGHRAALTVGAAGILRMAAGEGEFMDHPDSGDRDE
ncbi:peptidase domain-containing ABC transporter [Nocardia sp. NPDC057455]|uniref:peptidase domain-containing ABC transporter n=1 Tax=Nocardia sp. NPDC057455 TaxID=3346138 RepID=UPI003670F6C7